MNFFKCLINVALIAIFSVNTIFSSARAFDAAFVPQVKQPVIVQDAGIMRLRGLKVYANDPFKLDFIVQEQQNQNLPETLLPAKVSPAESEKLIKYFLSALTIPEKDLWVNLSPYEKDRIIPDAFGQTTMGRGMLAQDYILKQLTASLIKPQTDAGRLFWQKVYAEM